jgi:hypothetical protein
MKNPFAAVIITMFLGPILVMAYAGEKAEQRKHELELANLRSQVQTPCQVDTLTKTK